MPPLGIFILGLVLGSLAGLNSLGFVLLWRTTRIINLAQAAMGLVGGVVTGMLVASAGWSFWWSAPVGLAIGALLGIAAERLVLVRLQDVPRTVLLVATLGLAQVFGAMYLAVPFVFGGTLPSFSVSLGFTVDVFPVRLLGPHLLALITFPLATVALWRFLRHTRLGVAACALGQDTERARVLGVPAKSVRTLVWGIAGALSALSGILTIPVLGFGLGEPVGPIVLLLAFAPAVLVGLRSVWATFAAALAIGVAYQVALWVAPSAGAADLLLAFVIVVAVAAQRNRLGRAESASRASSWEAATSPRPLPWGIARSPRIRVATAVAALVLVALAAAPPLWLSPSNNVLFATSAALALAAVAVAAAWLFAGEIALGHWGLVGFGAVIAIAVPGPVFVGAIVATVAIGASGALLALVARRRTGLAFAVLSLAAAVAAPVAILQYGKVAPPGDLRTAAMVAGAIAAVAAVAVSRLRSTRLGVRMVAARDDPARAPWLGVDPLRVRVVALTVSAALAGLAGALYVMVLPTRIAPSAFDAARSFDLLAMTIVGGLGSPIGALLGVGGLRAVELMAPGAWASLASGAGILLVVIFLPGGLSTILGRLRNLGVRLLTGYRLSPVATVADEDGTDPVATVAHSAAEHIAGSDTRAANATPSVRAAATSAFAFGSLLWASAFVAPNAFQHHLSLPGSVGPWLAAATLGAAVLTGVAAWRLLPAVFPDGPAATGPVLGAAAGIGAIALYVWAFGDELFGALALPLLAVAAAGAVGALARIATRAVVPDTASAAAGIVTLGALLGALGAGHLAGMLVTGPRHAAAWGVAFAGFAAFWTVRVRTHLPEDRQRARIRALTRPTDRDATATRPALELTQVSVTFAANNVLADVDLAVRPGEMVALVGANGAGKSTLLRVAAGFLPVASGRVELAGEDVSTLHPEERAAAGLAMVSGARAVFPDLTVLENLRVGAFRTHRTQAGFLSSAEAVLELVPTIADRRHDLVGLLSGGEQRLVAIAQTMFRRPLALLADELTLGLDIDARHAALDVLRTLADDGVAVVVVDHDLPSLLPRCDRAVLLTAGSMTHYDDPEELLRQRADLLPATFLTGVTT